MSDGADGGFEGGHFSFAGTHITEVLFGVVALNINDYAIGEFLKEARQRAWFKNTVFVIVADHCHRSAGRTDLPVAKYHIPLIVYCPGRIRSGVCDSLCSQMDLAPTLLGLMNVTYDSLFFGQDVLSRPPQRALLGTYQLLGLLRNDRLTVLMPGKKAEAFKITSEGRQHRVEPDREELLDTISYYQAASLVLKHRRRVSGGAR